MALSPGKGGGGRRRVGRHGKQWGNGELGEWMKDNLAGVDNLLYHLGVPCQ